MQFTVMINQYRSLEWGLNANQAILFSYLYEATSWASQVQKDGEFYWYMAKNKVITELPLLTDKPDTVYRLMKQLEKLDLITVSRAGHQLVYSLKDKAKLWNKIPKNSGKISDIPASKISEKNPKNTPITDKNPPNSGNISEKITEKNPTYHITNKSSNQDHKTNTSAEPEVSPPAISIPTNKFKTSGEEYHVSEQQVFDWQETYPAVDVRQTLKVIRSWNTNNPQKRKTLGGMASHIDRWLAKDQNKGGTRATNWPNNTQPNAPRRIETQAEEVFAECAAEEAGSGFMGAYEPTVSPPMG